jgi:PhnB protein
VSTPGRDAQAVAAGDTSVTEVTHLFFGDRMGRARDPLGDLYWIHTRVEDVTVLSSVPVRAEVPEIVA